MTPLVQGPHCLVGLPFSAAAATESNILWYGQPYCSCTKLVSIYTNWPSVFKMTCEPPRNWNVPLNHIHWTNLEYPRSKQKYYNSPVRLFWIIYHEFLRSGKVVAVTQKCMYIIVLHIDIKHRMYVSRLSLNNIMHVWIYSILNHNWRYIKLWPHD